MIEAMRKLPTLAFVLIAILLPLPAQNAGSDLSAPGPARDVTSLSFSGSELINAFNAEDHPRLLVLFSPT